MPKITVSVGELFDKVSILDISCECCESVGVIVSSFVLNVCI